MSRPAPAFKSRLAATVLLSAGAVLLAACNTVGVGDSLKLRQSYTNGYVVDPQALELVPVGSSQEQVTLALGTPSTINAFGGRQAFYYISQQRTRPVAFAKSRLIGQRVLAVYFDSEQKVDQIADYGLQDGRLFDFVTRTTPTGGADASFLMNVIRGLAGGGRPSGSNPIMGL
ncbi:MAG: outer membrane protein assembly factor BamE [Rhizobiaceae bacterium]|jgi:outer membrane protein assembly factor BamE (lipoprotein component of BamABCDE complex)|nr:outer membrane protein assembly factor BamE [Rhizobiaceae bacterium]